MAARTPRFQVSPQRTPMEAVWEERPVQHAAPRPPTPMRPRATDSPPPIMRPSTPQGRGMAVYLRPPNQRGIWLVDQRSPIHTPPVFAPPPDQDMDYFNLTPQRAASPDALGITGDTSQDEEAGGVPLSPHAEPDVMRMTLPVRQRTRSSERRELTENALDQTAMGRNIISLRHYRWYTLRNGLVAMRFNQSESLWRAHETARHINWLCEDAHCYRSSVNRIIAVANIDSLNAVLADYNQRPIQPAHYPPRWSYDAEHREPEFMQWSFASEYLSRAA